MENEIFDAMHKVETQHWWFVARRKIIESIIKNLDLGKNLQIMDAGCGNGDNLAFLSKYGDVVAMDTDDNALVNARARCIGKVLKGDLPDNLPKDIGKDNDLIVMLDVLEHIDDDAKSLVVLRDCIKESGKLIITVPAYQFLLSNHDKLHHHKRRYSVQYLKKIIESNGWKVDYISYFNTFLFPLALIDRIRQIVFPPTKDNVLNVPHKWINSFFERIFSFESKLIGQFIFPFGLSIMVVARKI